MYKNEFDNYIKNIKKLSISNLNLQSKKFFERNKNHPPK